MFAGLNLGVQPGEILRVEGRNGSGKTSLLRILAGLAQPVHGAVLWNGAAIHDSQTEYFQNLLYIGHKPGIKYELSAIENLCLSRALFGSRTANEHAAIDTSKNEWAHSLLVPHPPLARANGSPSPPRGEDKLESLRDIHINGIEEALYQIGLYGFEDMPAAMLSAGQKRRVALAQLYLTCAPLWILDEPYTSLDVAAVALLEDLFRLHVQAGGMLIMTSHQPVNIAGCVTKRLALPDTTVAQVA